MSPGVKRELNQLREMIEGLRASLEAVEERLEALESKPKPGRPRKDAGVNAEAH